MGNVQVLLHPIPGKYLTMPERSLPAVKPLLSYIVDDYWKPVIEPASPEEIAMADKRMKDYEKDPSSFISLEDIK
jgi:hypothetical protein